MKRYKMFWVPTGIYIGDIDDGTTEAMTLEIAHLQMLKDHCSLTDHGEIRFHKARMVVEETKSTRYGDLINLLIRFEEIIKPKKVISDRCKDCNAQGTWGPRAQLLCPICHAYIGGLG